MTEETTIGIDLGDKKSHIYVLSGDGEVLERAEVPTTMVAMRRRFGNCESLRIAIEAGGQSSWVSDLLKELGHEVIVANPRKLRMIYENDSKCDAVDAEQLARVARLDLKLPQPVQHRDRSARADLNKTRSRDLLTDRTSKRGVDTPVTVAWGLILRYPHPRGPRGSARAAIGLFAEPNSPDFAPSDEHHRFASPRPAASTLPKSAG
ncbi:Transposase [Planctomycetes bacterium Poly30]|uniref:Transposase n=2 Tax=Saltatorellus ferox TaxID=2528018 RepID=A0A518EYV5_9BACT|nr:Transposase [Planctomycetes bacterium Poly30]